MATMTKVRSDLDQASAAVGAARTMVNQGQAVDLTGLESHVETLCTDINRLEPGDRTALKPSLVALIDDLNKLAVNIAERNRAIGEQLRDTGTRERATTAYTAGSGNPPRR